MWTSGGASAAGSGPGSAVDRECSPDGRRRQCRSIATTVTARTAKAINYQHRSGATKIDFRGTELLPGSRGEAKVESKQGYIEIEVEFDDLQPATKHGSEYLTYVLWAITPRAARPTWVRSC